jgi:hypothetical protein
MSPLARREICRAGSGFTAQPGLPIAQDPALLGSCGSVLSPPALPAPTQRLAEFVAQAAGIQAQLGKDRGVVLAAHIHRVRELLRAWLAWAY